MDDSDFFMQKARDCLAGAESEYANKRFDNCANRAYYASFHAAIAALLRTGFRLPTSGKWPHSLVQAEFSRLLIHRMKRFPSNLRDALTRNMDLRHAADYRPEPVPEIMAARALRRARAFVEAVEL